MVLIALRVLAWTLVYATTLRSLAAAVGLWAAGTLTAVATLLVAVVAPLWLFLFFPTWFAWRILHPFGMRAAVLVACWLSPLARARDLRSIRVFLDVAAGRPFPPPEAVPADAWTALGAALQADGQGSFERAARIVDALAHLPAGSRFPWLARVYGVDTLIASAVRRGDFEAATRYARLGGSRLARLVTAVADGRVGPVVPARVWWLRWLLAPMRLRTRRLVRDAATRRPEAVSVIEPPGAAVAARREGDLPAPSAGPRLRHVLLLRASARQESVSLEEVFTLAAAWQRDLDEAALARVHARALELGARNGEARARALRDTVLEELAALATTAVGRRPPSPSDGPLVRELAERVRERLCRRVEVALAPLRGRQHAPPDNALEAWERWLILRAALDDVELVAGTQALTALWYGGVRDTVWGWSCALFNEARAGGNAARGRSGWVAHMMFSWVADRAEVLGDFSATLVNRENARSALAVS